MLLPLELLSQFLLQPDQIQRPPIASSTPVTRAELSVIPAARNEPIGLKATDFLPVSVSEQNFLAGVSAGWHQKKGVLGGAKVSLVLSAACSHGSECSSQRTCSFSALTPASLLSCLQTALTCSSCGISTSGLLDQAPIETDSRLMQTQPGQFMLMKNVLLNQGTRDEAKTPNDSTFQTVIHLENCCLPLHAHNYFVVIFASCILEASWPLLRRVFPNPEREKDQRASSL